ncbi:MAG: dihydrofolate reductase [Holosporales bacterium]|jgi:dihydrofolate reductase|nr:dihydrofolate reductase [Holosporales bacterium]
MRRLIAIVDQENGVAKGGGIPWSFPEDLAFFRQKTRGATVFMGRKTFLGLPVRPLPDKHNVVLSRTHSTLPGAEVFTSLEKALEQYSDGWIMGGAQLYAYALEQELVDMVYLTRMRQAYGADVCLKDAHWKAFSWYKLRETEGADFLLGLRSVPPNTRESL